MSFIVIEGLDGSGKSTQVNKLKDYLTDKNIAYKYLHFPVVEKGIFGDLIARFLRGDLGDINNVDPYLVGLIYAEDRNDSKQLINKWLEEGFLVLVDRYVYSNIAFQCAKLDKESEINELKDWILNLEYNYFKIPKPDLNIFLDVPFDFVKAKLSERQADENRDYLQGKKDIHEADTGFQEKVRNRYLSAVEGDESFRKITCAGESGEMLPPDVIFSKLKEVIGL